MSQLFIALDTNDLRGALNLVLTKEQIKQHSDKLGAETVIKRKDISLDEVAEMFPGKRIEFYPRGFYTEEEIAKHPQFFNHKIGNKLGNLYFTRETLKILNRFWKTRQSYNKENSDVTGILLHHIDEMTPEIIRYLESKGEIDWSQFYSRIKEHHTSEINPVISKLIDFFEKYKN